MDALDINAIRNNLVQIRAWIRHWQEDVRCNLPPTETSLADAHEIVACSLVLIDRATRRPAPVIEHKEAS